MSLIWLKKMDLRPYGAFIEHTIRPLFEESEGLLKEFTKLDINKEDINKLLSGVTIIHIFDTIVEFLKTTICTAIIGYAAYQISCRT